MDNDILNMCFNALETADTFRNERDYYQSLYYNSELERKDLLRQVEELKAEINRLKAEKKSE